MAEKTWAEKVKEGGFTMVPNDDGDNLLGRGLLSKNQMQIVWELMRYSWGWQREDTIAEPVLPKGLTNRKLAELTLLTETSISRAVSGLLDIGVVTAEKKDDGLHYRLNPDTNAWNFPRTADEVKVLAKEQPKQKSKLRLSKLLSSDRTLTNGDKGLSERKETSLNKRDKKIDSDVVDLTTAETRKKNPLAPYKGVSVVGLHAASSWDRDANDVVTYLNEQLGERNAEPVDPRWWDASYEVALDMLYGSQIPKQHILNCIDWGFEDPYWHERLTSMAVVRNAWTQFKLKCNDQADMPEELRSSWYVASD